MRILAQYVRVLLTSFFSFDIWLLALNGPQKLEIVLYQDRRTKKIQDKPKTNKDSEGWRRYSRIANIYADQISVTYWQAILCCCTMVAVRSYVTYLNKTCVACSSSNVIFENLSVVSLTFSHWTELIPSESISIIMFTLHFTPIFPCSQVWRFSKNIELQMMLRVAWRSIISYSNSATVKVIRHFTSS